MIVDPKGNYHLAPYSSNRHDVNETEIISNSSSSVGVIMKTTATEGNITTNLQAMQLNHDIDELAINPQLLEQEMEHPMAIPDPQEQFIDLADQWQQISQNHVLAKKYQRIAHSAINVTMTIVILVSLLLPVLTIPTLVIGTIITFTLFRIAKNKAAIPYNRLSQSKIETINRGNFVKTRKVLSMLMLASLLTITVSVFFCVFQISFISAFIIPNISFILLAVFIAKIILDIPMQYISHKELDIQLKNIDCELVLLYQKSQKLRLQNVSQLPQLQQLYEDHHAESNEIANEIDNY